MSRDPFVARLRRAAADALPERAFLRRDRGDALYVTNALRLAPDAPWAERLDRAGFLVQAEDGLLRLWPGDVWMDALIRQYPSPPDFLCASLVRFAALPADEESVRLFAMGLRALEGEADLPFERRLRSRAAVCLRTGGGDGLYACGLLVHRINKNKER